MRLNEKRDVSCTETEGHWASKLRTHRRLGPPVRAPKFDGPGGFLSLLSPAAHLTEIGPVSRPLPLTSMADRVMVKKLGKILFEVPGPGPFSGWKSLLTLRTCSGVKSSKK